MISTPRGPRLYIFEWTLSGMGCVVVVPGLYNPYAYLKSTLKPGL